MKTFEQLEKEIDELIKIRKIKELIVNRLLKIIKEEDLGMNQVTFHKEWYD
jgi:hypothetical protein